MKAWLARDKSNMLYLYLADKPYKGENLWHTDSDYLFVPFPNEALPSGINPKWEDEEPIEVKIHISKASDKMVRILDERYTQLLQYESEYLQRQSMVEKLTR